MQPRGDPAQFKPAYKDERCLACQTTPRPAPALAAPVVDGLLAMHPPSVQRRTTFTTFEGDRDRVPRFDTLGTPRAPVTHNLTVLAGETEGDFADLREDEYTAVEKSTTLPIVRPTSSSQDTLTEVLRDGANRHLAKAVRVEVASSIGSHTHIKDDAGDH